MNATVRQFAVGIDTVVLCVINGVGLSLAASAGSGIDSVWSSSTGAIDAMQSGLNMYGSVAIFIGGGTGLIVSPIVIPCLLNKPAFWPAVVLWGPLYVVAFLGAIAAGPLLAWAASFGGLVMVSVIIRLTWPNFRESWQCAMCAYDLRGLDFGASRCPECGKAIEQTKEEKE